MSVAVYVLAGYDRREPASAEAGLKYFLIGAFASGFLLYGIALVYGATGTTNLALASAPSSATGALPADGRLGLGLLLIGFGFKVAAVPFHMWAPDVYDGAPTPVTGFMATGGQGGGVRRAGPGPGRRVPGGRARSGSRSSGSWRSLTMVLGNLVALAQKVAQADAGLQLRSPTRATCWSRSGPAAPLGLAALMLYLLAYGVTTLAAFGLLAALGRDGERDVTLDDIAGLASRAAVARASRSSVCMLSLLGFPGTLGFIGKWYILSAVSAAASEASLAVVLVLTSVVSAGYYLPVIMAMYMRPARAPLVHTRGPGWRRRGLGRWRRRGRHPRARRAGPPRVLDVAGAERQALLAARPRLAGPWPVPEAALDRETAGAGPRSPSSANTTSAASWTGSSRPSLARALGRAFATVGLGPPGHGPGPRRRPRQPSVGRASRRRGSCRHRGAGRDRGRCRGCCRRPRSTSRFTR